MRAHDIDRMMSVHVAYVAMWGVKLICGMWHAACGMWHARTFIVFWQGMCVQGVCAGRMCRAYVQGVCAGRVCKACVEGVCAGRVRSSKLAHQCEAEALEPIDVGGDALL